MSNKFFYKFLLIFLFYQNILYADIFTIESAEIEILDRGKGGLLYEVGDYKALANKILFYKKNKSECNKKLKYAQKRLVRFDYNKNLNLYFKMVNKIL